MRDERIWIAFSVHSVASSTNASVISREPRDVKSGSDGYW